ncbi:hypothetical protein V1517DRAFT_350088 [Lipomyces orientalis]|uniref:Uncharacterized protein n=1 Tax=Lipomyces orientalis TaxID=1233043 RepID=A0ACC3TYD7_9ASCO
MSAAPSTHWSSLWASFVSMFIASGPNSGSTNAPASPVAASTSPQADLVRSYALPRFGVFSLFSPLSTAGLLASLFSGPKYLVSSFLNVIFPASKRIDSKHGPAPIVTPATANAAVATDSGSPTTTRTANLFPQIILDVRLTATSPDRVSATSPSNVQTATPCATDQSATLLQVHNAGGELVGFDLSDAGMMQSSSSYMLQFAPQVQFQPQQQFVPQLVPLDHQLLNTPPATAGDQGDFLNKLDELEVYIAEMRNKLASSGTGRTSIGYADDATSPSSVPRVVRRRNERQSVAAPYSRPIYASVPSYELQANDSSGFVVPSPDLTVQTSSVLLPPRAVNQPLPSPSASAGSSTYSPAESTTWSPPSLVDDSSPASASIDDNYTFTGSFSDHVDYHPDVKFFDGNAGLDLSVPNASCTGEHEQFDGDSKFVPQFPPEQMMPFGTMPVFQAPFAPPQSQNVSYPHVHPHFMYGNNQMSVVQAPGPHIADVSSTASSSPRSSMGSPQVSSPTSSNSSPSSSPGKQHALVHSRSSSPSQPSSAPTFQCPHCSSKFRIKGYLTRHLKKHAVNKAYTCPFFDPTSSTPCHSTGGFSRRDTYKTHLKSRHFVYPAGTRSDQRAGMRGWCAACGMLFACNENWVENHVEGGECRAFHGIPMYG